MPETWRAIPGYERLYEVSIQGCVRRIGRNRGAVVGRIMKPRKMKKGYLYLDLSRDDCKKRFSVHHIVALAFIGPAPTPLHEINHKDLNKENNVPTNLEWMTSAENVQHAIANGACGWRPLYGEQNGRTKLTMAQVQEIRRLKGVHGARIIAQQFGISRSAVQFIHQGKHWQEIRP